MEQRGNLKSKLLAASAFATLLVAGCSGEKEAEAKVEKAEVAVSEKKVMKGDSPIDKPFKLDNAEPLEVDSFLAMMNDGEDDGLSFASSSFDEKIGATVLEGVTAADEDGTLTIGRVELYGVNTDYIERLQNEEIADTKEQIFRKVRMFDLVFAGGEEGEEAGSVTIGGLEVDGLKFGGFSPEDMEGLSDGQEFATVMKAFDLGGIYLKDLAVVGMEAEGTGIDMKVDDMRFGGFAGGKVGAMSFFNMDYTINQSAEARAMMAEEAGPEMAGVFNGPLGAILFPENQQAKVESLTWDGMSFAGLLPYLEKGEQPPVSAKDLLSFGKIEAKNTVAMINGKEAAKTGYSVVEPVEFAWFVPTKIKSYSEDTTMDLTAYVPEGQPELLALFEENGLDKVKGDGSMLWAYDDAKGDAKLEYNIDMTGLARIDLNFKASDAVLETLYSAAQNEDETAFMNMALDGFSLKIENDKLLDVLFGVAALQTGQDAEQLRAGAPMMISMGGAQFAALNPAFPGYLEALSGWVSSGGTIELKIAPETPVTMGALAAQGQTAPQELPDVLNLTVTHSE